MGNELTVFNPQDILESQAIAGQTSSSMSMPFVPIITVNNKTEIKTAMIDGMETQVKVPAKKGFLMLKKDEVTNELKEEFLEGNLHGVILKERFMIEKKFVKGQDQYRSDEFDTWNETIVLYDKKDRKNVIDKGTYSQIKNSHVITDNNGKVTKEYDLFVVLYVNLEMTGKIVRLKIKMTQDCNWFDYKNSFSNVEPWAGYVTNFNLLEKKVGDISYWHVNMDKGQMISLTEQLELQRELNKYFQATKKKTDDKADSTEQPFFDEEVIDVGVDDIDVEKEEDISIDDIPF